MSIDPEVELLAKSGSKRNLHLAALNDAVEQNNKRSNVDPKNFYFSNEAFDAVIVKLQAHLVQNAASKSPSQSYEASITLDELCETLSDDDAKGFIEALNSMFSIGVKSHALQDICDDVYQILVQGYVKKYDLNGTDMLLTLIELCVGLIMAHRKDAPKRLKELVKNLPKGEASFVLKTIAKFSFSKATAPVEEDEDRTAFLETFNRLLPTEGVINYGKEAWAFLSTFLNLTPSFKNITRQESVRISKAGSGKTYTASKADGKDASLTINANGGFRLSFEKPIPVRVTTDGHQMNRVDETDQRIILEAVKSQMPSFEDFTLVDDLLSGLQKGAKTYATFQPTGPEQDFQTNDIAKFVNPTLGFMDHLIWHRPEYNEFLGAVTSKAKVFLAPLKVVDKTKIVGFDLMSAPNDIANKRLVDRSQ